MSIWKKILNVANFLFGGLFNIAIAVAVIIAAYSITMWAFDFGQTILIDEEYYDRESVDVLVSIPDDASVLEIARILREYELINNEWIFYLNATLNGAGRHFRAGLHMLNTSMSESTIMYQLQALREIPADSPRITIVEGLTNWQIAEVAATLGYFTAAEFRYEVENGLFAHAFLQDIPERPNRLEGFLFPDTYYLPPNPTPRDLIIRMLNRFNYVFTPDLWLAIDVLNDRFGMELTINDVIIIASIIEREAIVREERPIVASIIYNRLMAGMPLEMVSTVVYATNTRRDLLTPAEFQANSPYNTFNRTGLPIGPISNPGINSILAALNPIHTNFLYMVINDHDSHSHFFTASHEEYLAARLRYAVVEEAEE